MTPKNVMTMTKEEYKEYQLVCQDCNKLRIDCDCENDDGGII